MSLPGPTRKRVAQDLDRFFSEIPKDSRYHVGLRNEAYLADPVFGVLKKHGVGLVFSHWTWLPPLRKQFAKAKVEVRMSYEESLISG